MYPNVKTISREQYQAMLEQGLRFRDWSLYEPQNNPKKTYFVVQLGKYLTVNKTRVP